MSHPFFMEQVSSILNWSTMANQGLLTSLQPPGTEDYDLEKQQEVLATGIELGEALLKVLTAPSVRVS